MKEIEIAGRKIGEHHPPFVIAEIGINHEGSFKKAVELVEAAAKVGAECVKFQCHIIEDEMIKNDVIPPNSGEPIWQMMERCALTENEEKELKKITEKKGMIYLSTPFSRAAAERLYRMDVAAFKIGSGECNSLPLIKHIAKYRKPVILSTGMNNLDSIRRSVYIVKSYGCPLSITQCTSMYPTPYEKVYLGALTQLSNEFEVPVGLSDHSIGIFTCLGAVALGASILEKHFTCSRAWDGADIPISIEPRELQELIRGSKAVWLAKGGSKQILQEEQQVINFAYSCVVTIKQVKAGEFFTKDNIWVKRPGTGSIPASKYTEIIGKKSSKDISKNIQLSDEDIL